MATKKRKTCAETAGTTSRASAQPVYYLQVDLGNEGGKVFGIFSSKECALEYLVKFGIVDSEDIHGDDSDQDGGDNNAEESSGPSKDDSQQDSIDNEARESPDTGVLDTAAGGPKYKEDSEEAQKPKVITTIELKQETLVHSGLFKRFYTKWGSDDQDMVIQLCRTSMNSQICDEYNE